MAAIRTAGLTHRYGSGEALSGVDLEVPEGTLYALLGPNGAGKTTLLEILAGLRRATSGRASVLGRDVGKRGGPDRARVMYIAADRPLPDWMTLAELEAYLAPLYERWDRSLADHLRDRFRLPADRKLRTLSRGERMKAAMLCGLAPRPRLLLLDEPFTGMDALVRDELVRGLLEVVDGEDRTVLVASHEIGELEMLADRVGVLDQGELVISEPMETVRERFKRIEVVDPGPSALKRGDLPDDWLAVEFSEPRIGFLLRLKRGEQAEERIRAWFPAAARVEVRSATLREIFVGLAGARPRPATPAEVAAP